mmetsp:Transcript_85796/g.229510  ORF Transcript_85796/g.229510 Transcript_85796/m.229510 type:complete len:223 (+) Transcript_85796:343-1011(+)
MPRVLKCHLPRTRTCRGNTTTVSAGALTATQYVLRLEDTPSCQQKCPPAAIRRRQPTQQSDWAQIRAEAELSTGGHLTLACLTAATGLVHQGCSWLGWRRRAPAALRALVSPGATRAAATEDARGREAASAPARRCTRRGPRRYPPSSATRPIVQLSLPADCVSPTMTHEPPVSVSPRTPRTQPWSGQREFVQTVHGFATRGAFVDSIASVGRQLPATLEQA